MKRKLARAYLIIVGVAIFLIVEILLWSVWQFGLAFHGLIAFGLSLNWACDHMDD